MLPFDKIKWDRSCFFKIYIYFFYGKYLPKVSHPDWRLNCVQRDDYLWPEMNTWWQWIIWMLCGLYVKSDPWWRLRGSCISLVYSFRCTTLPPSSGYQLSEHVPLWSSSEITPCHGALCRKPEDQLERGVFSYSCCCAISVLSFHGSNISHPESPLSSDHNEERKKCGSIQYCIECNRMVLNIVVVSTANICIQQVFPVEED